MPVPVAVKIPNALLATRAGERLLRALLEITCNETAPNGALDGMTALICEALT